MNNKTRNSAILSAIAISLVIVLLMYISVTFQNQGSHKSDYFYSMSEWIIMYASFALAMFAVNFTSSLICLYVGLRSPLASFAFFTAMGMLIGAAISVGIFYFASECQEYDPCPTGSRYVSVLSLYAGLTLSVPSCVLTWFLRRPDKDATP